MQAARSVRRWNHRRTLTDADTADSKIKVPHGPNNCEFGTTWVPRRQDDVGVPVALADGIKAAMAKQTAALAASVVFFRALLAGGLVAGRAATLA